MTAVGEQGLSAAGIPHLHGCSSASGGEALAVRRPRYTVYEHSVMIAFIGEQGLPTAGIPHLHVAACGGEAFAVRRPRYTQHCGSMTFIGEQGLSAARIPDLHSLIKA